MDESISDEIFRGVGRYVRRGGRWTGGVYGSDVAPAVYRLGYKMAKTAQYARFGQAAYNVGKRIINSFSKNEKKMPPLPTPRKTPKTKYVPVRQPDGSIRYEGLQRLNAKARIVKQKIRMARKSKTSRRVLRIQSKSAGKVERGNSSQSRYDYYTKNGITLVTEYGVSLAGTAGANPTQTMLFGHATIAHRQGLLALCYAMIKHVATHLDLSFDYWSDQINGTGPIVNFHLDFQREVNGAGVTYSVATDTYPSWGQVALRFYELLLVDLQTTWTNFQFNAFRVARGSGVTEERILKLNLKKAKFSYYAKSSMKFQNLTVGKATETESDDVSNVPLYGKSYEGSGNFIKVQEQIISPQVTLPSALYYATGVSLVSMPAFAEPPTKAQVERARLSGKVHLDPGEIKTSVLTYEKTFSLNYFWNRLAKYTGSQSISELGNMRYICLEKMIQAVATSNDNLLRVNTEVDLKIGAKFVATKHRIIVPTIDLSPL